MAVDEVIKNKGCLTGDLELSDEVAANIACASDDEIVYGSECHSCSFKFQVSSLPSTMPP